MRHCIYCLLFFLIQLLTMQAEACPLVRRMIDFNCDQRFKIAVTGDSIVYGVGDERNDNKGGYVRRLRRRFNATNLGVPGITSDGLLRAFNRNIKKEKTSKLLRNADIVIIDVGRNDYWDDVSPESVARNIKRIVAFLSNKYKRRDLRVKPFFMVSTLIPTARSFQQPFVSEVNSALLRMSNRKRFPVNLLFHSNFSTSVLSYDQLHPDSAGYDAIADFIKKQLRGDVQVEMAKMRPDRDNDGIFNRFEEKYGTDKRNPDSDGDSIPDGADVFGE